MNLLTCTRARLAARILKTPAGRDRDCLTKLLQVRFGDGDPDQDLLAWLEEQPRVPFPPV